MDFYKHDLMILPRSQYTLYTDQHLEPIFKPIFYKQCYTSPVTDNSLTLRRIFHTWWPLAASWMLMSAESPALSAIVARLADPKINLAAYGGVVFPLALIIESPIIMLLAASTALSRDWASYVRIRRFMMITSAALTALHLLVAFTPIYYLIAEGLLHAPAEIIEPARTGLIIMTPWTWSIAYRRFHQGVLIRFGRSKAITTGTFIRLATDVLILGIGFLIHTIPGIVVATSAVAMGVIAEAAYIGLVVRPVLRYQLHPAPPVDPPLTQGKFMDFYIPLVLTSLISLLVNPIGSAAMGRMPSPVESLAVWQVLGGLIFMVRSLGIAYNEVVVALLDEFRSSPALRRFATYLISITTLIWILLVATPIANIWFTLVTALDPQLAQMARLGAWMALPMPAISVLQSWFQGAILYSRRTGAITEAVVIYLAINLITLILGVVWGKTTGIFIGVGSLVLSSLAQTFWLWLRSRPALVEIHTRDS
mgnify:FL=1